MKDHFKVNWRRVWWVWMGGYVVLIAADALGSSWEGNSKAAYAYGLTFIWIIVFMIETFLHDNTRKRYRDLLKEFIDFIREIKEASLSEKNVQP